MSFTLRFSRQSVADIERTLAYTLRQFGTTKYADYKQLIRQALLDIAADPMRAPAKTRPEIHPQARTFHIGEASLPGIFSSTASPTTSTSILADSFMIRWT